MPAFQETELKLRLIDPSLYDRLASDPLLCADSREGCREAVYDSVYYDTADRRLLSGGLALRVRNTGEGYVATVKDMGTMSGGLSVRGEWNVPVPGGAPSAGAFTGLPVAEKLMGLMVGLPLEPLMKTTFRRVTRVLRSGADTIEFSADRGEIAAAGESEPLCEVELELKNGSAASLLKLGAELAARYPLTIDKRSKFERGLLLLGIAPSSVPGFRLDGEREASFRAVMTGRLVGALDLVLDAEAQFYSRPGVSESAHMLRVSLRRLRALLSFARPFLDAGLYSGLKQKLRALSNGFSAIRELDVLRETWRSARREEREAAPQKSGLEAFLRAERNKERERLVKTFSHAPATAVLLEVWAAVLGELWTKRADGDFQVLACKRLKKWTSRFRECLVATPFNELEKAHSLRLLGKNIRYVQDALGMSGGDAAPVGQKVLKRIQNKLGALCDAGRNTELLEELIKTQTDSLLQSEAKLLLAQQRRAFRELAERLGDEVR